METAAIQLKNLTKTFGKVVANDKVSLEIHHGEILALLGDMRELGATTDMLHASVGEMYAKENPDYLFTYGELSSKNLADGAVKNGMNESKIFRNPVADPETVGKKILSVLREGDVLLVKASRGLSAEKVLNVVKAQLV